MLALKHMKWNDPEKKMEWKGKTKQNKTKQNHFLLNTAIVTLFNHLKLHENTVKLIELVKEEVKRPRTGENQISKPDGPPGGGICLSQSERQRPQPPGSSGRLRLMPEKPALAQEFRWLDADSQERSQWFEMKPPPPPHVFLHWCPPTENKSTPSPAEDTNCGTMETLI